MGRTDKGQTDLKQETQTHSDTGRVDLKQVRIRQDRQRRGKGNSKHYKQVSTVIFDDVFMSKN